VETDCELMCSITRLCTKKNDGVGCYTLPQTNLLRSNSVEQSKTPGMHNLGFLPVLLRAQKKLPHCTTYTHL
jgi:hypothetical protein